jgi:hypothetical protein
MTHWFPRALDLQLMIAQKRIGLRLEWFCELTITHVVLPALLTLNLLIGPVYH